jgi:hypothetical protein
MAGVANAVPTQATETEPAAVGMCPLLALVLLGDCKLQTAGMFFIRCTAGMQLQQ